MYMRDLEYIVCSTCQWQNVPLNSGGRGSLYLSSLDLKTKWVRDAVGRHPKSVVETVPRLSGDTVVYDERMSHNGQRGVVQHEQKIVVLRKHHA